MFDEGEGAGLCLSKGMSTNGCLHVWHCTSTERYGVNPQNDPRSIFNELNFALSRSENAKPKQEGLIEFTLAVKQTSTVNSHVFVRINSHTCSAQISCTLMWKNAYYRRSSEHTQIFIFPESRSIAYTYGVANSFFLSKMNLFFITFLFNSCV